MTDEDLEARLRRFAVAGPPSDLPARTRRRLQRREDVRDLTIGCGLAAAVAVVMAIMGTAAPLEPRDARLAAALADPARRDDITFAVEMLGGGPAAIEYALLVTTPADPPGGAALSPAARLLEQQSW